MIMDEVVKDLGELTADVVSVIISSHAGNAGPLLEPVVNFLLKNGLDKVIKDVVSTYSTIYYKDASIIVTSGGLGAIKAFLISFVAGFIIACVVNLVLSREMLTYEYRLNLNYLF